MGSRDDWFRRTSWTELDQHEFEQRLRRARSASRPQYLRIQAGALVGTADPALIRAGIALTERFLEDYPDDWQTPWVHEICAGAHEALDEILAAVDCYRKAIDAQRRRPNVRSNAWLSLGWLVTRHSLTSLYSEAEALLDEFTTELPFPVQRHRCHAIRALIAAERGYGARAQEEARLALEAAAATHSGFRYHASLGLVGSIPDGVAQRLRILSAG